MDTYFDFHENLNMQTKLNEVQMQINLKTKNKKSERLI